MKASNTAPVCRVCGETLSMMANVYAPIYKADKAIPRVLQMWGCNSAHFCQSVVVNRIQYPSIPIKTPAPIAVETPEEDTPCTTPVVDDWAVTEEWGGDNEENDAVDDILSMMDTTEREEEKVYYHIPRRPRSRRRQRETQQQQQLRYELGGTPICAGDLPLDTLVDSEAAAKCPCCNGPVRFECQLMSPYIYLTKAYQHAKKLKRKDEMQFHTVLVYTCVGCCTGGLPVDGETPSQTAISTPILVPETGIAVSEE
ncbi:hypothetical protein KIPB_010445, partial [Kipferlia bialata]|eukprot:g10445.t1